MAFNAQAETLNDGTQVKIWRAAEAFLQAHHIHHAGDDRMRGIVDGVLAGLSRREIASLDPSSSLVMGLINNAAAPVINAINAPANKYGALPNGMIIGPDGKPVSIHDHNLRGHGRAAGAYGGSGSSADEDGGGRSSSGGRIKYWDGSNGDYKTFEREYRGLGFKPADIQTFHSVGLHQPDFNRLAAEYGRGHVVAAAKDTNDLKWRGKDAVKVVSEANKVDRNATKEMKALQDKLLKEQDAKKREEMERAFVNKGKTDAARKVRQGLIEQHRKQMEQKLKNGQLNPNASLGDIQKAGQIQLPSLSAIMGDSGPLQAASAEKSVPANSPEAQPPLNKTTDAPQQKTTNDKKSEPQTQGQEGKEQKSAQASQKSINTVAPKPA